MKFFYAILFLNFFAFFPIRAQDYPEQKEITQKVIVLFESGDYSDIHALFDDQMKAAISSERLNQIWKTLPLQCGKYMGYGEAVADKVQGLVVVNQLLDFELVDLDIKLVFNENDQISGLFFVPPVKKKSEETELISNRTFSEKKILVKSGDFELPGIMTIPVGLSFYPIVVFIHGSGPNDRDETFGPNKPFRDLAHGLANYGIASLRYDKRTFVYREKSVSEGEVIDLNTEVLLDAQHAIALAGSTDGVREVYVLGHSLGAMMAPRIATENQEIAGIILLAGNARPLEALIIDQYTYLFSSDGMNKREERLLHDLDVQISNLKLLKANPDTSGLSLPLDLAPAYWLSLLEYDQLKEIKSVSSRILILQGERDYQVTMEDFQLWKEALQNNEKAQFKSYPKLNHLFLEGEGASLPAEYQVKGHVPDYVIKDIAGWILKYN